MKTLKIKKNVTAVSGPYRGYYDCSMSTTTVYLRDLPIFEFTRFRQDV